MRSIFHTILQWDLRCRKFSPRVVEVRDQPHPIMLNHYLQISHLFWQRMYFFHNMPFSLMCAINRFDGALLMSI
jgi:hypothetical protein